MPPIQTVPARRPFDSILAGIAIAAGFAFAPAAHAQVWNEIGDAGDQLATAQATVCAGPLTTITGALGSPADVDLYCIQIGLFPNAILPMLSIGCLSDQSPNLWLFDAAGLGIGTNEICSGGSKTVGTLTIPGPGTYYLAVSFSGIVPSSASGPMWLSGILVEHGPDGPGGAAPLASWGGAPVVLPPNPYQVGLSFTGCCDAPVPAATPSWGSLKIRYGS